MNQEQRLSEDQEQALRHKKRVFQIIGIVSLSILAPSTVLFGITPVLSPVHELFAWLAGASCFALSLWICLAGVVLRAPPPKRPRPASVEKQVKQESFSAYEQDYQEHQHTPMLSALEETPGPETSPEQPAYEQPLVSYPEIRPM